MFFYIIYWIYSFYILEYMHYYYYYIHFNLTFILDNGNKVYSNLINVLNIINWVIILAISLNNTNNDIQPLIF